MHALTPSHPHTLTGHKDSVTCTGFSSDGKYVATADMGGGVRVWRVEGGDLVCSFETSDIEVSIIMVWSLCHVCHRPILVWESDSPPSQWLQWHSSAHVLLAGTSDGVAWVWRVPSGECKTLQGPNCRNMCAALMSDGECTTSLSIHSLSSQHGNRTSSVHYQEHSMLAYIGGVCALT